MVMGKPKLQKFYVAIPYSNVDKELSFKIANKISASLIKAGQIPFSPITHGHAIVQENELPTDFAFWEKNCLSFIQWADALLVVQIVGWKESVGVTAEINFAKALGKEIIYLAKEVIDYWDELIEKTIGERR